jgi:hypothetical protein
MPVEPITDAELRRLVAMAAENPNIILMIPKGLEEMEKFAVDARRFKYCLPRLLARIAADRAKIERLKAWCEGLFEAKPTRRRGTAKAKDSGAV